MFGTDAINIIIKERCVLFPCTIREYDFSNPKSRSIERPNKKVITAKYTKRTPLRVPFL